MRVKPIEPLDPRELANAWAVACDMLATALPADKIARHHVEMLDLVLGYAKQSLVESLGEITPARQEVLTELFAEVDEWRDRQVRIIDEWLDEQRFARRYVRRAVR